METTTTTAISSKCVYLLQQFKLPWHFELHSIWRDRQEHLFEEHLALQ